MHILVSSNGISFQVYSQNTFLVLHIYTNIQSHQHKIIQLSWIHMVHICDIYKFDTVTVWSIICITANWWYHQKIAFQNDSCYMLTSSVSMVFQSSCNIMGSIPHICCPYSKKLYVLHWAVEILQLNTIGVPIIYTWKNLLGNNL